MCDIFEKSDLQKLFKGKSILFLGDSIMRNIYKDFIWLSSPDTAQSYIPQIHMRSKGEEKFCGDVLLNMSEKTNGRDYEEERDYYNKDLDLQYSFIFITKCFSRRLKHLLDDYPQRFGSYPDMILINSALWDINRWGPRGILYFRDNIKNLMDHLKFSLRDSPHTQVVWMTTPPISVEIRGGFMIEQLEFQKHSMRFNVAECNQFASHCCASYGFDVLDMHFYMLTQIHRRAMDGIHWNPDAVRMQVNTIITHYCLSREIELPQNWVKGQPPNKRNLMLEEVQKMANVAYDDLQPHKRIREEMEKEKRRYDRF